MPEPALCYVEYEAPLYPRCNLNWGLVWEVGIDADRHACSRFMPRRRSAPAPRHAGWECRPGKHRISGEVMEIRQPPLQQGILGFHTPANVHARLRLLSMHPPGAPGSHKALDQPRLMAGMNSRPCLWV